MSDQNKCSKIIEEIFHGRYRKGELIVDIKREDIEKVADKMGIKLPKKLGDLIYSFRYRAELPPSVRKLAPKGMEWIIRPKGRSLYQFAAVKTGKITPSLLLAETKIPDATPGIIAKYAMSEEQALLAKLRYNRLIDIFSGVACYSLQSHLRTTVPKIGQVETDEVYIGLDRRGVHYILPVQAKSKRDQISVVQIEQDIAVCSYKFPSLIVRSVAAQFMEGGLIALFEFEFDKDGAKIISEKHYRLVPKDELNDKELESYKKHSQ